MTDPHRDAPVEAAELPDTICPMPWVNLSLDVDGSSRPCCKFAQLRGLDSPYEMANLRDASLADVWHSEGMRRLRRDFRAGERPAECSTCWDEEAAGIQSYRQTFVAYRDLTPEIDYDDDRPPAPAALDLKLSNACNLKCRICGPVASSTWLQEELSLGEPTPGSFLAELAEDRLYYRANKITRSPADRETLRSWLSTLEYLELTGGEPMMSPENRELIELIATEGAPEQVGILFNTNATVLDDRILGRLRRFREVKVCLSIDDVGERLEYERAPARWADVEANLDRYQDVAGEGWDLYAFCSVSVFNVWYLPEYVRWLRARQDRVPLQFVANLVHYPRHLSIQVLPAAVKATLDDRLRTEIVEDPEVPTEIVEAIEEVRRFLAGARADDSASWRQAVATIAERDGIRGEHFARVFPELTSQLERAGAWPPPMPVDLS